MALTTKELMLLQDNIMMAKSTQKFIQGCSEITTEPQLKNLYQQISTSEQNEIQCLTKHIGSNNFQ